MNSAKKYSVKKCSAKDALKTALLDLLQRRSFVKISVYDLCSHAHISRSAFYVNFEDKYELLAYCLEERKAEFDHFIRNHSPEESLSYPGRQHQQQHSPYFQVPVRLLHGR